MTEKRVLLPYEDYEIRTSIRPSHGKSYDEVRWNIIPPAGENEPTVIVEPYGPVRYGGVRSWDVVRRLEGSRPLRRRSSLSLASFILVGTQDISPRSIHEVSIFPLDGEGAIVPLEYAGSIPVEAPEVAVDGLKIYLRGEEPTEAEQDLLATIQTLRFSVLHDEVPNIMKRPL